MPARTTFLAACEVTIPGLLIDLWRRRLATVTDLISASPITSAPSTPQPLLEIRNLVKHFPINRGLLKRTIGHVKAVDGVSYSVMKGETFGLVGESGCGKSTTAKLVLRLLRPTSGQIFLDGSDITSLDNAGVRLMRKDLQIVFQDPYASLDPRMTVRQIIAEPMIVQGVSKGEAQIGRAHV